MFYFKAEKTAYYSNDKARLVAVLPKIKAEISLEKIKATAFLVEAWQPVFVAREPRRLL